MEKYQTAERLIIRRPCPVKIFLVSLLDLSSLCIQSRRNEQRWNFFPFWKRLRIVNEDRTFSNEKLVYFREKYGGS